MLKKLYDKSNIAFAIAWIAAYCVLMSIADSLSVYIGVEKSVTLPVGIFLSALLFVFLLRNGLLDTYGICVPKCSAKSMLYYIPVVVMLTANFWCGVAMNYGALETMLYILTMLCVGFLEEIIFRGLLFNAMIKDNTKAAIIVSSLTFGIGHIINLVNGSGTDLLPNVLQIIYATAAGFMFVMIYYKSRSIVVCIASHGIFNALSAFSAEASQSTEVMVVTAVLLTVITGSYAIYLAINARKNDASQ